MVRNLWCVGRNYQAHVDELGNKVYADPFDISKSRFLLTRSS